MCHFDSGYEYRADAARRSTRIGIGADFLDACWVEDHHVRDCARTDLTAVLQMELARRQARHLVDRGVEIEHLLLAHVMPQYASDAIPQTRMRLGDDRRYALGSNHCGTGRRLPPAARGCSSAGQHAHP